MMRPLDALELRALRQAQSVLRSARRDGTRIPRSNVKVPGDLRQPAAKRWDAARRPCRTTCYASSRDLCEYGRTSDHANRRLVHRETTFRGAVDGPDWRNQG